MSSKKYLAIVTMIIALMQIPTTANARTHIAGITAEYCSNILHMESTQPKKVRSLLKDIIPVFFSGLNISQIANKRREYADLQNIDTKESSERLLEYCKINPYQPVSRVLIQMWFELPAYNK